MALPPLNFNLASNPVAQSRGEVTATTGEKVFNVAAPGQTSLLMLGGLAVLALLILRR